MKPKKPRKKIQKAKRSWVDDWQSYHRLKYGKDDETLLVRLEIKRERL